MSEIVSTSWLRTNRSQLGLFAIIGGYIAFNSVLLWISYQNSPENDYFITFVVGALAFEALSFGIWLAMGTGTLVTRLPVVIVGVSIVAAALGLVASHMEPWDRFEFIALVLSSSAILVASSIVFSIVRWFLQRRIISQDSQSGSEHRKVRFSMRYLLALTTGVAVALGTASLLTLKEPEPRPYFGPDFEIFVMVVGGLIVSGIVLPITVLPLFLLHGHATQRALAFAAGFWCVVTASTSLYWSLNEGGSQPDILLSILLAQFSAAIVGTCAGLTLKLAGFRLEQIQRNNVISTSEPSNS